MASSGLEIASLRSRLAKDQQGSLRGQSLEQLRDSFPVPTSGILCRQKGQEMGMDCMSQRSFRSPRGKIYENEGRTAAAGHDPARRKTPAGVVSSLWIHQKRRPLRVGNSPGHGSDRSRHRERSASRRCTTTETTKLRQTENRIFMTLLRLVGTTGAPGRQAAVRPPAAPPHWRARRAGLFPWSHPAMFSGRRLRGA